MEEERRKSRRFRLDQCVTLSFAHEDFIDAQGLNLSMGGLQFISKAAVDIYQKIFVMIEVPEGTIKAEGVVVHVERREDDFLYGLKFTDIASEYRAVLQEYCLKDPDFQFDFENNPPIL